MPVSDEDLEKKRATLDKLREQLSDAQTTREDRERELANDLYMRQLDAEEARLRAALTQAREAAKAGSVKAGVADLIDTVKDQEAVAQEQARATENAAKSAGKE